MKWRLLNSDAHKKNHNIRITKSLLIFTILFVRFSKAYSDDYVDVYNTSEVSPHTKYEKRIEHYESFWNKLIPKYQKVQFAGSMGFLSTGPGWLYGKGKWETDLLIGFIPKFDDTKAKATITIKQNYIPWSLHIGKSRFSIEPLTCGMYVNSILDDRFWKKEPERYPDNYYKFSTRIRFHVFLGQRWTYDLKDNKRKFHKSVSFFYELSSCDLYIISAATNKTIKPKDYLGLSFGVKLQVF